MTSHNELSTILASLVSILGLWCLLFWLYRDYCVDRFRQKMFALRDDLFDAAAGGLFPFDHPAYGLLRSTMNGFIRFGHRLTLLQVVLFTLSSVQEVKQAGNDEFSETWEKALKSLTPEQARAIKEFEARMHLSVFEHLVIGSPILVVTIVVPLLGWLAARFCLAWVLKSLSDPFGRLDSAAMAYGQ